MGRGGAILTPTNSFLLLGIYTSVSKLVRIDKEMRPWEWRHTDRHTHTDTQTQTNLIICPMLYAIAMGQIIKNLNSVFLFFRFLNPKNIGFWNPILQPCYAPYRQITSQLKLALDWIEARWTVAYVTSHKDYIGNAGRIKRAGIADW